MLVMWIYSLGFMGSAVLYNWQYAQSHGFLEWLVFGEVVATGKAFVWPYFAVQYISDKNDLASELPNSVLLFLKSQDALAEAEIEIMQRGADPSEVLDRFQEAVDLARFIQPEELDDLYPGLGKHFLEEAITGFAYFILAVENEDQVTFELSRDLVGEWGAWWRTHASDVVGAIEEKYGLQFAD